MIHPKFMPMLDFLIEHGLHEQMQIQVFTNASWVPKKRITDRLAQFKNVTISLSIDGVKEVNDYSRYPSKWDIVEESARKWVAMGRDIECVNVRIEPTLSIYNALTIVDLIKWWIELSMEVRDKPFHEAIYNDYLEDINIILNSIHEPTYLSPNILPAKSIPNQRINEYIVDMKRMYWIEENDKAKNMVKGLRSILVEVKAHINADAEPSKLKSFIKFSGTLDIRRNNSIKSKLPELWDIVTAG
jgi:sulfatase maturation enzyme AslB (radical SAM superfamily)